MTGAPPARVPTPHEFEAILTRFINHTLLGGQGAVDRDTRLFEDGYINSLRILDLIAMVEKTLGRRIPDRAVRLANFRTVGTIVQAFHPEAAGVPAGADRLFDRRRDRSRFASPVAALEQRGDLRVTGAGQVALSGVALDILEAIDATVAEWARALGAPEHRFPSLIDRSVLERAGQTATTAVVASPDSVPAPAVCYHAYPEWTGKTLGPNPTLLTARGRCYRDEDGGQVPLERLREFTMREIIVMGTREQVEDVRQSLVRHVTSFIERLELDAAIETATDPFFTSGDEARRLMQQAGALKYELRLSVDPAGRAIAVASFNHHHDFFGTRFDVRLTGGAAAHTGCVAFGLERWVLALFAQHGVDPRAWPNAARTWLDDSRLRAPGAGA
jgi:seryl-tRNA synthetase/acyl carrier protein